MSARGPNAPVYAPNLGVYLGAARLAAPRRALLGCRNVRIKQQKIVRDNLGWRAFPDVATRINLYGEPVTLIDTFRPRSGPARTIFANGRDIFALNLAGDAVEYLTPRYGTGTASQMFDETTVTGSFGADWDQHVSPGDQFAFGANVIDPSADWYTVVSVTSDMELELDRPRAGFSIAGSAYTIRKVFSGGLRDPWLPEVFYAGEDLTVGSDGDRWYAANGVDPVIAWDGTADQVYLPDLGDIETASFVRRYKNVMVYGVPRVSGELRSFSVRTSALQRPEDVVTLEASEFTVHDGTDPLLNAYPLGENLVVYGAASVSLMQFVGAPLMFVVRTAVANTEQEKMGFGVRSARAIARFPDRHEYLAADGMYRFDGARSTLIDEHVWREVTRTISPQRLDLVQAVVDTEQSEVLWVVPLTGDPDPEDGPPATALVKHYAEDVGEYSGVPYTIRDLPATAFGRVQRETTLTFDQLAEQWSELNVRWDDQAIQAAFPQIVFGTADGDVFILNASNLQDGAPFDSWVRFARRPLGSTRKKGRVKRIYPFTEGVSDDTALLHVLFYGAEATDGTSTLLSAQPMAMNGGRFVTPRKVSRFADLEFRTTDYAGYWALLGYELEVVPAGERDR